MVAWHGGSSLCMRIHGIAAGGRKASEHARASKSARSMCMVLSMRPTCHPSTQPEARNVREFKASDGAVAFAVGSARTWRPSHRDGLFQEDSPMMKLPCLARAIYGYLRILVTKKTCLQCNPDVLMSQATNSRTINWKQTGSSQQDHGTVPPDALSARIIRPSRSARRCDATTRCTQRSCAATARWAPSTRSR